MNYILIIKFSHHNLFHCFIILECQALKDLKEMFVPETVHKSEVQFAEALSRKILKSIIFLISQAQL